MKIYKIAKYGDQAKKFWMSQKPFTNLDVGEGTIDWYISEFGKIRQQNPKELYKQDIVRVPIQQRNDINAYKNFKDLELMVDYVLGQRKSKSNNLEHETEIKPIYSQDGLEIYRGNSPNECVQIKGNDDASWCVARQGASNMYNGYRFSGEQPTFYFIKDKNRTDEYGFCVLQVKNDQSYTLTSHDNDGDKTMEWEEITQIIPKIKNLQQLFVNIPLTEEEEEAYDDYSEGISDKEFLRLPFEKKKLYLDVNNGAINGYEEEKFSLMPDELKNYWLGFGYGLKEKQHEEIKDNKQLMQRYKEITNRKVSEYIKNENLRSEITFTMSELLTLDEVTRSRLTKYLRSKAIANLLHESNDKKQIVQLLGQETIEKLQSADIAFLLRHAYNIQEIIELLGPNCINKIDDVEFGLLLRHADHKQNIIDLILKYKTNELTPQNVYDLLYQAPDKVHIAKVLGKNNIDKLTPDLIKDLLSFGYDNKEIMASVLRENMGKLSNKGDMTNNQIVTILLRAGDRGKMADILGAEHINNLSDGNVYYLLMKDRDIADIILKYKRNNLTNSNIFALILMAYYPKEMVQKLGPLVNRLSQKEIDELIRMSLNPTLIREALGILPPKRQPQTQEPQTNQQMVAKSLNWYKSSKRKNFK